MKVNTVLEAAVISGINHHLFSYKIPELQDIHKLTPIRQRQVNWEIFQDDLLAKKQEHFRRVYPCLIDTLD